MSSVVVWFQVWMLELSVRFFNVNCKWQLAVGCRPFSGRPFRLLAVLDNLTFVQSNFWPRKNIIVHQQTNVSRKSRDFETFMENVFLIRNSSPPPGDFSKVHIFSKSCCFTLEILFWHPEQKNRFFRKMFFWPRKRVPLILGGKHSVPAPDQHRTIIHHENGGFDVFYKKCSFDPADIQAIKQANN